LTCHASLPYRLQGHTGTSARVVPFLRSNPAKRIAV